MTIKEAIIELRDIQSQDCNRCFDDSVQAIDMAIKALEILEILEQIKQIK